MFPKLSEGAFWLSIFAVVTLTLDSSSYVSNPRDGDTTLVLGYNGLESQKVSFNFLVD